MSLAIAALNATGITKIHQTEATSISYPNFAKTLEQICTYSSFHVGRPQ